MFHPSEAIAYLHMLRSTTVPRFAVSARASLIAGLEYGMERWNGLWNGLRMRITH